MNNPKSTTITLLGASFTVVDVLWLADNKVVNIAKGATECKVSLLDQVIQSSGSGCVYKPSCQLMNYCIWTAVPLEDLA